MNIKLRLKGIILQLVRALIFAVVIIEVFLPPAPAYAATYSVNTTNDVDNGACTAGHCSLREAINAANANPGPDTISFNVPGSGPHVIIADSLPILSDPGTVIDGTTQPGYAGSPIVEVRWSGSGAVADPATDPLYASYVMPALAPGFWIQASGITIRGLSLTAWTSGAVLIEGSAATDILIEESYIGLRPDGVTPLGNEWLGGIGIFNGASTVEIQNNVISGNEKGILVAATCPFICGGGGGGPSDVDIDNNLIGTDAGGTTDVGNLNTGISVVQSPNTNISNNLISGNDSVGIFIGHQEAVANPIETTVLVSGNTIGTDLSGTSPLGNGIWGIWIASGDNSQIMNNVISANLSHGVYVSSSEIPITGLLIQGNMIGTTADGSAAIGTQERGIGLSFGSSGTQVIGNVISGNTIIGVDITSDTHDNVLLDNLIGLDVTGAIAVGNGTGISASESLSSNNQIGLPGQGNVISGNTRGIAVFDSPGIKFQGNFIGTDASGSYAVSNIHGIYLAGASGVVIGGSIPGEGNIISGNTEDGIIMLFESAGNQVHGNTIGLDASGSPLANAVGVHVRGNGNQIGGPLMGQGNVISGNTFTGIFVPEGVNHLIAGNYIGANAFGGPAGNGGDGISIDASNTEVSANLIAHNGSVAVRIVGGVGNLISQNQMYENALGVFALSGEGHTISQNSMYDNDFLGIDLATYPLTYHEVTLNDPGDTDIGVNDLLNYPVFNSITPSLVEGTACAGCIVEVFLSDNDPSGHGEGASFLGDGIAAGGSFSIPIAAGELQPCDEITSTATDSNGNTSEFSPNATSTAFFCLVKETVTHPGIVIVPGIVVGFAVYKRRKSLPWGVGGFIVGAGVCGVVLLVANAVSDNRPMVEDSLGSPDRPTSIVTPLSVPSELSIDSPEPTKEQIMPTETPTPTATPTATLEPSETPTGKPTKAGPSPTKAGPSPTKAGPSPTKAGPSPTKPGKVTPTPTKASKK